MIGDAAVNDQISAMLTGPLLKGPLRYFIIIIIKFANEGLHPFLKLELLSIVWLI